MKDRGVRDPACQIFSASVREFYLEANTFPLVFILYTDQTERHGQYVPNIGSGYFLWCKVYIHGRDRQTELTSSTHRDVNKH